MESVIEAALQELLSPDDPNSIGNETIMNCAEDLLVIDPLAAPISIKACLTFVEANVATTNKGVVLTLNDDAEFHITIVQV